MRTVERTAVVACMRVAALGSLSIPMGIHAPLLAQSTAPMEAAAPIAPQKLEQIAAKSMERHELPGFVLAVVTKDGVESVVATGARVRGEPATLESADRMHLGSCTKAFTATLAAALVAEGVLRWESTIAEVLGKDAPAIAEPWRAVTLEELLRHRSGASTFPVDADWKAAFACNAAPEACRKAFVDAMLARTPTQRRGQFAYSNQGYTIAGRMIEVAGGKPFEQLLGQRVLEPLGIASACFGPPSRIDAASPKGHNALGAVKDDDNPNAIAPAGTLCMSLPDWAKFVAFHLGGTPPESLKGAAGQLARMHAPGPDGPREAIGWITAKRDWGGSVLTFTGSNTMWVATAWLAPERGFAVLAATNQGGERATRACDEACGLAIKARNGAGAPAAPATDQGMARPSGSRGQ